MEQNKLVIFIDDAPPAASAIDATQPVTTLVIPLTLLSSGSRDNELSTWLTKRLLDEASRQADFNPLWQPVLQGFQRYFVLRQQKREVWQALANFSEPGQLVAHLSLQIAQGPIEIGEETHPGQDSLRFFATTTWADYVVNTYGTQRLPALLKGFKRYNSWEELSPAVFGISAHQLEASWRKYLAIHYDR